MSSHEYDLVAGGWLVLLLFLTLFWYATLNRLSTVMKEWLSSTRSHQSVPDFAGLFLFILRGEFMRTGDERLISVCRRLRQLLYGYLGSIVAYIVFLTIFRPR